MTLQEIIKSLDDLSIENKTFLLNLLKSQLSQNKEKEEIKSFNPDGENFREMTLRFRERMEREGIEFTDEDFANLRDRSPGKEIEM
ncbi:hypothetical protein [Anabaena azotica]|uniref:hypothetical protein n=1 Tax=Anabaena azotica TaxID=197653 RepID=UPI0039A640CF